METGKLNLQGVSSQADADKVLQALNEVWGVREAEVRFRSQEVIISFDENAASLHDFEQAIIDSGFGVSK
ncbi:heavy metal-associated domain-containing protein [Robertmurraya sp. DFI.2.37]|uniref:heavy-metal-associated domain-containing protein n=1 Tax=Robertmurraya sp. DFI.2.37 TaxID=3031819 RepID=UPI001247D69F|nr:heavy metal-associated domain-containing protein [Robertmurraya sp. DFI.2.37]MDF1507056.1 heavy metal-associated domain-containing protein [Robertmurraya sp. DFI.2.37]